MKPVPRYIGVQGRPGQLPRHAVGRQSLPFLELLQRLAGASAEDPVRADPFLPRPSQGVLKQLYVISLHAIRQNIHFSLSFPDSSCK